MIARRSQQKYDGYCGRSEVARACLAVTWIGCATDVGRSYAMSPRTEGAALGNHGTRSDVGESQGMSIFRKCRPASWRSWRVAGVNLIRRETGLR
jgi:hypothetical protein